MVMFPTREFEVDFEKYQEIIERCGIDSAFRDMLIKDPVVVLRSNGIDVPAGTTLDQFAKTACSSVSVLAFEDVQTLRDDELESPVACTNNSKSRSGPWTNATNCYKSCGLC